MSGLDPKGLERVKGRMATVDAMSPELRALVHEHGLSVIQQFLACGVTSVRHITHLIDTVRRGSYEVGNRERSEAMEREHIQRCAGSLAAHGLLVVPEAITDAMVEASVGALEVEGIAHTNVARNRKHAVRLRHAILVGNAQARGRLS